MLQSEKAYSPAHLLDIKHMTPMMGVIAPIVIWITQNVPDCSMGWIACMGNLFNLS